MSRPLPSVSFVVACVNGETFCLREAQRAREQAEPVWAEWWNREAERWRERLREHEREMAACRS